VNSTKFIFPHRTLFQFMCPYRPEPWAGSRAGPPFSECVSPISSTDYLFAGNQTKPPVEPPVTPTKPGSRRDSAATPTKRVSFMPEQEKRTQEVDLDEEEEEEVS
jgi:hypothetical protein